MFEANRKIIEHISLVKQESNQNYSKVASTSTSDLLNSVDNSTPIKNSQQNNNKQSNSTIDFQITADTQNDLKDEYGNDILCFGEGNNVDSLIIDNASLLIR